MQNPLCLRRDDEPAGHAVGSCRQVDAGRQRSAPRIATAPRGVKLTLLLGEASAHLDDPILEPGVGSTIGFCNNGSMRPSVVHRAIEFAIPCEAYCAARSSWHVAQTAGPTYSASGPRLSNVGTGSAALQPATSTRATRPRTLRFDRGSEQDGVVPLRWVGFGEVRHEVEAAALVAALRARDDEVGDGGEIPELA